MKAITIQKPPDISWDCPHPCFELQILFRWFSTLFLTLQHYDSTRRPIYTQLLSYFHRHTELLQPDRCTHTHICKTQLHTNWHSIEPPVSSCSETWLPCIDLDLHKMGWSSLTDHNFLCTHDKVLLTLRKLIFLNYNNTITKQI